jgi:hypothetical protein
MRARLRWARVVGGPTALVLAGGLVLVAPSDAATTTPCVMRVTLDRVSSVTYSSGVERQRYNVQVSWNGRSQSAEVQRMIMPAGAQPRLVTKKLGTLGQLRAQLDSPKGKRGIAAVNGDFFYDYRIDGQTVYLPRNASVSNSTPVRLGPDPTRVVGIDRNGKPYNAELGISATVTRGSQTFTVDRLNWQTLPSSSVAIYTPAWADVSLARRPAGAVEWVVKKGAIVSVRSGSTAGGTVQPGTRVVAFGSNVASAAARAVKGQRVTITVRQKTEGNVVLREAIGRANSLVDAGRVDLPCASRWFDPRPRTAVGWSARGNWMTLSLPGTGYDRNGYRIGGLGLAQEANVAVALGFTEASELDGGGSTTAYIRRADGNWDRVDDPDGIWQRPIPNSLIWLKPRK